MKWFRSKSASSNGDHSAETNLTEAGKLLQQARAEFGSGRAVEALKLTQRAAATGEPLPELYFFQALCLDRVGRHEEAMRAFARELEINPEHAAAREAHDRFAKALGKPVSKKLSLSERSWKTSLSRENLLAIQQSLHNYAYRGVPMLKNPFDVALYPMLIWKTKPRTIIEIGSKSGGSGLWFGDLLQTMRIDGRVVSIDIVRVSDVTHPLVTFLEGDGRNLGGALTEDFIAELPRPWLVIEDADHSYETSKAVLEFFDPLLREDEYIVIEDGIISDLQAGPEGDSGPHRALKEFFGKRGRAYEIDGDYCDFFGYNVTWCTNGFLKKIKRQIEPPRAREPAKRQPAGDLVMVNLGCGNHFHPAWKNLDVAPQKPGVVAHDLRKPLPFADASCDVVYHSHVLEHFPKALAPGFMRECFRILRPGGIIRVAVPDLEQIARLYLSNLDAATNGDRDAADRYEWMTLEMMDQMVRDRSGGEMLRYWMQNPMPAEEFVVDRMGREVIGVLDQVRKNPALRSQGPVVFPKPEEVGEFRDSGEPHKWMYDRFSLKTMLDRCGFERVKVCAANESSIPDFAAYHLDVLENGETRKPDSLFMEARKPQTALPG